MIEQDLVTYLLADGTIAGLVGTRIGPLPLPEKQTMPALTFSRISRTRTYTQDGPAGLVRARFQCDCWASDGATVSGFDQASQLVNAVIARLNGFSGTMGSTAIQLITVEGPIDGFEHTREQDRPVLDIDVWFVGT